MYSISPPSMTHLDSQHVAGMRPHMKTSHAVQALSGCLIRLAVQHCNIVDITPLAALQQLQNMNLAGNDVQQVASIQGLVGSCPGLQALDVRDNPLCSLRSYRQASISKLLLLLTAAVCPPILCLSSLLACCLPGCPT